MFDFDKDYLYHSFYSLGRTNEELNRLKFEDILKSGYILSRRNIFGKLCENMKCLFNGNDYISLSKKITDFDLKKLLNMDISNLSNDMLIDILASLRLLCYSDEAFYRYVPFNPSFIFESGIGEVPTTLTDEYDIDFNGTTRYSNLMGEFQIKDYISLDKLVAISIPYDINIFIRKVQALCAYNFDRLENINDIYENIVNLIELTHKYLPHTPIVDISSEKVLKI